MKRLLLFLLLFINLITFTYPCSNSNIHDTVKLFESYNYVKITSSKLIVYSNKLQEAVKKMSDETAGMTAIAISMYAIEHNLELEYR